MDDCEWCEIRGRRDESRSLRPSFDEIVATGVDVHIEQLDDDLYWMSMERDGQRQVVVFESVKRGLIRAGTERDL